MECQSIKFDRSEQTFFLRPELSSVISSSKTREKGKLFLSFFLSYSFLFSLTFKIRVKSHRMVSFDLEFLAKR